MEGRVWVRYQTERQRNAIINQIEQLRRGSYEEFKHWFIFDGIIGRVPVYHIGEIPVDVLRFAQYQLTPVACTVPLDRIKWHMIRQARRSDLKIRVMTISKKVDDQGFYSIQAVIEFDGYVAIFPNTFQFPVEWGQPSKQRLSLVWRKERALQDIMYNCEQFTDYPGPSLQYPTTAKTELVSSDTRRKVFNNQDHRPAINYFSQQEYGRTQKIERPEYQAVTQRFGNLRVGTNYEEQDLISEAERIDNLLRIINGPPAQDIPSTTLAVLSRKINQTLISFRKRFRNQDELFDLLRRRCREVSEEMARRND